MDEGTAIDRLMDEWTYDESGRSLRFRDWLAERHPDKVALVERVLGPVQEPREFEAILAEIEAEDLS